MMQDTTGSGDPVVSPRDEISELIGAQESRIGEVHLLRQQGLDPREIADHLGNATTGFTYQCFAQIGAALDGDVPNSASMIRVVLPKLNTLVKQGRAGELSPPALQLLEEHREKVRSALELVDPADEARQEKQQEAEEEQELGQLRGHAGIYAFSYGWYLDNPMLSENDRTLIKVGRAVDVHKRLADHRRGARAHIPEPLVTIRVYSTGDGDLVQIERSFHKLLETAGHANPRRESTPGRRNEVGEEWYLTNRDFLDAIADALGLRMVYAG